MSSINFLFTSILYWWRANLHFICSINVSVFDMHCLNMFYIVLLLNCVTPYISLALISFQWETNFSHFPFCICHWICEYCKNITHVWKCIQVINRCKSIFSNKILKCLIVLLISLLHNYFTLKSQWFTYDEYESQRFLWVWERKWWYYLIGYSKN